jgi:soluble lytic murein transglycosylase-like protein
MVRLDLGAIFGDPVRAERILGSEDEREAALQELPPARRAHEAAMYTRAVARWAEFEHLVTAVVARPGQQRRLAYREILAAFAADGPVPIPADADALARDRIVLSMAMSGYGPNLIAHVVTGRLTIQVVERAARLRLLGHTDAEIARYLEAQVAARPAVPSPVIRERFDDAVVRYARQHGIDPDLVRAVIKHESAWNPAARSHKGAIGLMQLMPDTARLLGVDPVDPDQNIAGGIRYLADLRGLFDGNLDAVLVAYVAGPTYAQRWLRGQKVLDGEVRAYLNNVKTSYGRRSGWRKD